MWLWIWCGFVILGWFVGVCGCFMVWWVYEENDDYYDMIGGYYEMYYLGD